jgi:isoleucyl-tRNA synthetase
VIHGVGLDGCFKAEVTPVAGLFFKQADPVLNKLLVQRGLMFRQEKILHNYPFGWRTGDPLIYYAKEAWYIKTTAVKDRMVALNKTIKWVPETIRDGRFGNWLENNIDWALSRERFWGTPLPVWTDGEGDFICIGSLQELENLTGQSLTDLDLHRPQIDEIKFSKEGREYCRVPEVIDCWFDSGAMTYAQWHYPFENKETFEQHFPADYICEAIDQTRGWFYTLHAIASLVDDSVAFKNCVCLSHIVDETGKKMSKSQGNIVNPYDVFDTVGVDSLRWLFLSRTAPDAQKRISVDIVREVAATFVNTLWNTYSFFILYARLDNVDLDRVIAQEKRPEIDQWILALTHQTVKTVTESLDDYDAFTAGQAIEKLIDQLSNWYIRRNRRRFWKSDEGDDKQAAYLTLYECLDMIQRIIAPFMPFLSEQIYQNLRKADALAKQSVHLTHWPDYDPARLNPQLVYEMDVVQTIVGLGRSAREESRVRVRQPLAQILVSTIDPATRLAVNKHMQQIRDELNIREVNFIDSDAELVSYSIRPNFARLGKHFGKLMPDIKTELLKSDSAEIAKLVQQNKTFELEIAGQTLQFEPDDIQLQTKSAEGYACSSAEGFLVALDTTLNEPLIIEGIARELVRTIQDARKSAELEISDRIELAITGSERVMNAMQEYRDYIMSETLAVQLGQTHYDDFDVNRTLADEYWKISLRKASVCF